MATYESLAAVGHINGPVTWTEAAVLAVVVVVLAYCKWRFKY
jgi:hypothetical protein